jgi:hypothetical protein
MSVNLILFINIQPLHSISVQILNSKYVMQSLLMAFVYMILIRFSEGQQRKYYSQVQHRQAVCNV